jgi:thiosulfate dehydrogenase [quinone] large subunit
MATIAHGRSTAATGAVPAVGSKTETATAVATRYVFAGIRLALGWTFLWAFLDKLFGLGHETTSKQAWVNGGHPTLGFLKFSAKGPFTGFYHSIAGTWWADTLFMVGLAAIAIALIGGIGMRIAAVAGALLYVMMWSVVLPPENNLFMDDHLLFAAVLVGLALIGAGDTLGLGRWWAATPLVRRLPWLK